MDGQFVMSLIASLLFSLASFAHASETRLYLKCQGDAQHSKLVPFQVGSIALNAREVRDLDPTGKMGYQVSGERYFFKFFPNQAEPELLPGSLGIRDPDTHECYLV
jgi:hypothetical protein